MTWPRAPAPLHRPPKPAPARRRRRLPRTRLPDTRSAPCSSTPRPPQGSCASAASCNHAHPTQHAQHPLELHAPTGWRRGSPPASLLCQVPPWFAPREAPVVATGPLVAHVLLSEQYCHLTTHTGRRLGVIAPRKNSSCSQSLLRDGILAHCVESGSGCSCPSVRRWPAILRALCL